MHATLRALLVVGAIASCDRGGTLPVAETGALDGDACVTVAVVFDEAAWSADPDAVFDALPDSAQLTRTYDHFPVALVEVADPETAEALTDLDHVVLVEPITTFEPALDTALPFIGQPEVLDAGFDGTGVGVAIIDSGVDLTLPLLDPATQIVPLTASGITTPADHGTLVAGTVARTAPGASLVVLDVFEPGADTTTTEELLAAFDWVLEHHEAHGIRVVNLALAGTGPRSPEGCGEAQALGPATRALARVDIPVVAASGNHGHPDGLAAPACHADVWSVAGVWDERGTGRGTTAWGEPRGPDVLWEGSNTAADIDFGAPAMAIVMMPLGHTGTSVATAQVTGATALLFEQTPDMSTLQAHHRLHESGVPVVDGRSGHLLARIDVAEALTMVPHDEAPPTGAIRLAEGADVVGSRTVPVAITAHDPSGVARMCLSTRLQCTSWRPFEARTTIEAREEGHVTVRAWLEDAWGNRSGPLADSVRVDSRAPEDGVVYAEAGIARAVLAWSGFDDEGSGIAGFRIAAAVATPDAPAPAEGCSAPVWTGTHGPAVLSPLVSGLPHALRVCAVDRAGTASEGVVVTVVPVGELDPPVGSFEIVEAPWSPSTRVTLRLAAEDASEVVEACVSESPTECRGWFPMTGERTMRLRANQTTALYARYRDAWGNESLPKRAEVGVDTKRPVDGSVVADPHDGGVSLAWKGFEDALSGVVEIRVVRRSDGRLPRSRCTDTPVWSGVGSGVTVEGLPNGEIAALRVCAVDAAGHVSRGVAVTARPAPEHEPPTGAVVVAGGAELTGTRQVTLALEATDTSGVAAMCISTSAVCSGWTPYLTTTTHTLPPRDGAVRVQVWFEDAWGNRSPLPATDDIVLDTTPPADGLVSAVGGEGSVTVSWEGFEDAGSGVVDHQVVWRPERPPTTCRSGTPAPAIRSPVVLGGLEPGVTIGARVCAVDAAGHVSRGVGVIATPQ